MDEAEVVYARLGGDFQGRTLEPLFATYPPKYESEELSHVGEEFYYTLSGQLIITIEDVEYKLNPNDSIHFNSYRKHRVENRGEVPVHVVAVTTPTLLN
jgi:mannose-6-phosphate isomerase-like protein (cupin superfamily)